MKKYFLAIFIFFNVNIISEVKIEDCASIESDAKRLACYDYLVTGMSKSIDEIDVTTSGDSEERISSSAEKNSNFGLSIHLTMFSLFPVKKLSKQITS